MAVYSIDPALLCRCWAGSLGNTQVCDGGPQPAEREPARYFNAQRDCDSTRIPVARPTRAPLGQEFISHSA